MLKETAEALYLDVGGEVVRVPRVALVGRSAGLTAGGADAPTTASSEARSSLDAHGDHGADSFSLHSGEGPGPDPIGQDGAPIQPLSFRQILPDLMRGVVIVKNARGSGSGFLIDRDGNILTNHHVVRGEKYNSVTFVYQQGDSMVEKTIENAELIALSRLLDIALLKVPGERLAGLPISPLRLSAPGAVRAGDTVFAIGNPGVGQRQILEQSVSEGIISATNRNFGDVLYLQTTAAVNPGNSGGPLVNARGEVVGLITFKYMMLYEGLSFALPVQSIRQFLENRQAFAFGKQHPRTGYLYHAPDLWDEVRTPGE
ncbi:MAG: hypothetical protein Kow0059_03100 [Candidatus Sumerlaeia bacterium]